MYSCMYANSTTTRAKMCQSVRVHIHQQTYVRHGNWVVRLRSWEQMRHTQLHVYGLNHMWGVQCARECDGTRVHVHVFVYVSALARVNVSVDPARCALAQLHARLIAPLYMHLKSRVCVCIYIYMCSYIYIYICAPPSVFSLCAHMSAAFSPCTY